MIIGPEILTHKVFSARFMPIIKLTIDKKRAFFMIEGLLLFGLVIILRAFTQNK
jgi:hypothetical protein